MAAFAQKYFVWAVILCAPTFSFADSASEGWYFSLACPSSGTSYNGTFTSNTSSGFNGQGSCSRTSSHFSSFTFLSDAGATLNASSLFGLDTGDFLIVPPILSTETEPVFLAATACPQASETLNWIFVQWGSSWTSGLGSADTVAGSANYDIAIGLSITSEYSVTGGTVMASTLSLPGTCNSSTGIYTTSGSGDQGGSFYLNGNAGGVYKTQAGHAAAFFPQYAVNAASDLGNGTFNGMLFDSLSSSDTFPVQVTANSAGTTLTIKPYSDPSSGTLSSSFTDTIAISSVNSPASGMMAGSVTRSGSGAGTGKVICIIQTQHTLNTKVICSGTSPSNNSNPYTIAFSNDGLHSLGEETPLSNWNTEQSTYGANSVFRDASHLYVVDQLNNRVLIWNSFPTANQDADVVVGQPSLDFTSPGLSATSLNGPSTVYSDGTRLYVVDNYNNRVLIWNSIPTSSGKAADVVVGQPNMTTGSSGLSASALSSPYGVYSNGTNLYVSDSGNNRILVWNSIPSVNNAAANMAIGQANLTTNSSGTSSTKLSYPRGIHSDGSKFYVLDSSNCRALIWNTIPTSGTQAASVVLGQSSMSTVACSNNATASNLGYIYSIFSDGSKLYVPDTFHSRVLIWNSIPTSNNQAANVVLGQSSMTTTNEGDSASQMLAPSSVFSDGTKVYVSDLGYSRVMEWSSFPTSGQPADGVVGAYSLVSTILPATASRLFAPISVNLGAGKFIVADTYNHRVLMWSSIPTANIQNADLVLGQASMTTNSSGASSTSMNYPYFASTDGTRLYVADTYNNRVLIWNSIPTLSGQPADVVEGQIDMTSSGSGYSQASLNFPTGVTSDGTRLFVADTDNGRVLIWNSIPTSSGQSADVALIASGGPHSVYTDGSKLYVADSYNNRVLIWNSIPTVSNQSADFVLGQPNMSSTGSGTSSTALDVPTSVYSDGTSLYVVDQDNNRVLVWKSIPTSNGRAADIVLGQPNMTSNACAIGENSLCFPATIQVSGGKAYIADEDNDRILVLPLP